MPRPKFQHLRNDVGIQISASSNKSKLEQCKQRQFSENKHAQLAKRDKENCFIVVTIVTTSLPYMMASLNDKKTNKYFTFFLSIFQDFRFYSKF